MQKKTARHSGNVLNPDTTLRMKNLTAFFVPLGISALLVTVSHVIINGTLARATIQQELVISAYAIAMSVFGLFEHPLTLLRQTCSALVRDRRSFYSLFVVCFYLIVVLLGISVLIAFTPLGNWFFAIVFGAEGMLTEEIIHSFRVLIVVCLFSALRCMYQGIIIYQLRTKWLTIGMIIRLAAMYIVSLILIHHPERINAATAALIFLAGMVVEAAVSFLEGRQLLKNMPKVIEPNEYHQKRAIFRFYRPMLLSALISVALGPAINAGLGKTTSVELAIASYAVANSLVFMFVSFNTYMHQIVLNFYNRDRKLVFQFSCLFGLLPVFFLILLAFTPVGDLFLERIMGISGELLSATKATLQVFLPYVIVFTWVDYCNGLLMLNNQTRVMLWSQGTNIAVTVILLIALVALTPGWNGVIGGLAQSLGLVAELAVLVYVLRQMQRHDGNVRPNVTSGV
jgi:Na+-driven multidrug efflux pump